MYLFICFCYMAMHENYCYFNHDHFILYVFISFWYCSLVSFIYIVHIYFVYFLMFVSTIFPKFAYSFSRKVSACFGVSVGTLTRLTSSFFRADSILMFVSAAKLELTESGLVVFKYCLILHFTKWFWIYNIYRTILFLVWSSACVETRLVCIISNHQS